MGSSSTTRTRPSFIPLIRSIRGEAYHPRRRAVYDSRRMPTAPTLARSYEALRPLVLDRLLELRGSLDPSLGRVDDATARAQIGAVLDHLGNFIATGDLGLHRAFLHTFLAMRAAEAQSPANVLAMLVAIGDTAAIVAQEDSAGSADGPASGDAAKQLGAELTLLLTRVTASTARAVNDLIAEELERRTRSKGELAQREAKRP